MRPNLCSIGFTALLGAALGLAPACSQFKMPRLTDPPPPQHTIPASVTFIFDDSVKTATFQQTVCADTLWEGRLGDTIIQAFQQVGRARFAQVTVETTSQTPKPASSPQPSAITALIKLKHKSFTTRTRTGSDDQYISQLDVHLDATFQDANGRTLAEAPLVYSEPVKLWTPQYGGGGLCATQQLDEVVKTGAEQLADQLASYVGQLLTQPEGKTTAGRQAPGGHLPSGASTALTLRATLFDENTNLVLETGEKVGIRIDVTNSGTTPSGPASVTLSGTQSLIGAFTHALATPVQIPGLQPGETTSTMLWGRLPADLNESRGELTVTVTPTGAAGGAPASQTLVATMVARRGPAASALSRPEPAERPAPGGSHDPNRFAVIVGLSLYRSPWPGWRDGLVFDRKETVSLFADILDVPESHTLLLQDEMATQADLEEALASWLPKRITTDSIVFFYFAGQALADAKTGEVFLIPYDGTPASSQARLMSIRFLQSRLQRLGAKLALALIDSPLTQPPASKGTKLKPSAPNWTGDLNGSPEAKAGTLVQVARLTGASGSRQSLLNGLTGPADLDHDGVVTLGEWLRSLRGSAITAPTLPPTLALQAIPLTRLNHR